MFVQEEEEEPNLQTLTLLAKLLCKSKSVTCDVLYELGVRFSVVRIDQETDTVELLYAEEALQKLFPANKLEQTILDSAIERVETNRSKTK